MAKHFPPELDPTINDAGRKQGQSYLSWSVNLTPGIKVVTTSWDDGDALDLRVGDLLALEDWPELSMSLLKAITKGNG